MKKTKDVDAYIQSTPPAVRKKLQELRSIIKKVAPKAEEKISYGMPYYGYKGRLVYFAHMNGYIGLYIPPPIIKDHAIELKTYFTTKSAIHLPLAKLPITLIKKLIKARMKYNELKLL